MLNNYKIITIILIFFIACTEGKVPVLKIGKKIDKEKIEITEEVDTFRINDKLIYVLSHESPFNTDIITRRIYGNIELIYVKIYNRKTAVFLEDWVRPVQIESVKTLNELI